MNLIDDTESAVREKSACVVFIVYICRIQLVLVTASCLVTATCLVRNLRMKKCLYVKLQ